MTDHSVNQEKVSEPMQPQLCVKCYEFFGNAASLNMCSKCFRDATKESTPKEVKPLPVPRSPLPAVSCTPETSSASAAAADPKPMEVEPSPSSKELLGVPAPETTVEPKCVEVAKAESAAVAAAAAAPSRPPQKHKNRCFSCKKKIGLTGFKCRCGYIFCSEHRYSDKHECTFDYKLAGRAGIAKANPKVVASKINKI